MGEPVAHTYVPPLEHDSINKFTLDNANTNSNTPVENLHLPMEEPLNGSYLSFEGRF